MRIVVFGLSISSSWGNGHATIWRGLCSSLSRRKHHVVFFERDMPYYAAHRDFADVPNGSLVLYEDWKSIISEARKVLREADIGIVTSYCPDAIEACNLVLDCPSLVRAYYDLDTPITLQSKLSGEYPAYVPSYGLGDFDLILSYAGGPALDALQSEFNAKQVVPLYGCVDSRAYQPVPAIAEFRNALSYIGTYALDREPKLHKLFVDAAKQFPSERFFLAGALYPASFPWRTNIFYRSHVPPCDHPVFYSSSRITLNITRQAMTDFGFCPSSRLFEAAACGTPIISDWWDGIDRFFKPDAELFLAHSSEDVAAVLQKSDEELRRIAHRAQSRTLDEHTSDIRAAEMERAFLAIG
jgi:spore maturation protein CgeB